MASRGPSNMYRWLSAFVLGLLISLVSHAALAAPLTCPATVAGSVPTVGGQRQNGRLNRGTPPSLCAAPNAAPAVVNPGSKYTYDSRTFKNRTTATCITVTLTSADDVAAAAYLTSFVPTDIQANYLGDTGNRASAANPKTFSFDVPPLEDFVVVVTEGVDGAGGLYKIDVSGCGDVLVTGVTPNFGPTAGNTNVTIKGAGFVAGPPAPAVRFGGSLATNVVVVDEFTITAKTPAHAAGLVDVNVRNANGTNNTLVGGFTYYAPIAPAITLTSDINPSVFGQAVTFTAHVDPTAPATATGTITFRDGGTPIGTGTLDAAGNATFTTAALSVASHTVTATYPGDTLFGPGTSNTVTQLVAKADTTATLISSSNPSVITQPVTFTATITATAPGAGTPTGNVTFTDGAVVLGTVALNAAGEAKLTTAALAVGGHAIIATYAGDGRFNASTSDTLVQVVNLTGTTVTLASSLNPSTFGANVTFTATVSSNGGGAVTGTVTFSDGGAVLGAPVAVSAAGKATFAIATLAGGTHPITATYSGDATNLPAAGSISQVVNPAATTVTLISSVNPSAPGQSVTFTATVASAVAGAITGTVTFKDGAMTLGSAPLDAAKQATFTTTTLALGTHPITAVYEGTASFAARTSTVLDQVVSTGGGGDAGADAGLDGGSDAGPSPDAGQPDGGAKRDAASEAGAVDNGSAEGGGCGCRTTGPSDLQTSVGFGAAWLGVVAFLVARRRRRQR